MGRRRWPMDGGGLMMQDWRPSMFLSGGIGLNTNVSGNGGVGGSGAGDATSSSSGCSSPAAMVHAGGGIGGMATCLPTVSTPGPVWSLTEGDSSSNCSSPGAMSATGPPLFLPNGPNLSHPLVLAAVSNQQQTQPSTYDADQPLDLSAKGPVKPVVSSPVPDLTSKHFRAKPRLGPIGAGAGRKAYTEGELQAALRDIQSGRLGTRRAAVIYGIPRSTLRNKVYKLSQERRDKEDSEEEQEDEEEREVEKVLNRPLLNIEDMIRVDSNVHSGRTALIEAWPYLQQLLASPHQHPNLPDIIRNMLAEERLMQNGLDDNSLSHHIKVPAFRPQEENSTDSIQNKEISRPTFPSSLSSPSLPDLRKDSVIRNHNNNNIDDKLHLNNSPASHSSNIGNCSNSNNKNQGKGTRPKRGKYRNYDRDSLVEAVRAVQRGEMSVHRAGSYYGVPHSTLEYKVKERHLMRPRKREPKQPSLTEEVKRKDEAEKRAAVAVAAVAGIVSPTSIPTTTPSRPSPFPSPNGVKVPPYAGNLYHPPFPFWPSPTFPHIPYRPEIFAASQLLQQQHSSVMNKATREIAESLYESGSGNNASFLDGIIRSSLETGISGNPKDGRALLEHLVRGARLERRLSPTPPIMLSPSRPPSEPSSPSSPNQQESTRYASSPERSPSPDNNSQNHDT